MTILDASALIALTLDERGAGIVAAAARNALMSAVNVSEFLQRMADHGVPYQASQQELRRLEIVVVPFDIGHATQAAIFRPATKKNGLSLGDRACLALAFERQLPILTADRRMAEADLDLDIRLIR